MSSSNKLTAGARPSTKEDVRSHSNLGGVDRHDDKIWGDRPVVHYNERRRVRHVRHERPFGVVLPEIELARPFLTRLCLVLEGSEDNAAACRVKARVRKLVRVRIRASDQWSGSGSGSGLGLGFLLSHRKLEQARVLRGNAAAAGQLGRRCRTRLGVVVLLLQPCQAE